MNLKVTGTAVSNTDYNHFDNVYLSAFGYNNALIVGASDTNSFSDVHIDNASLFPVAFDYTINANWPAATVFFGIDPGANWARIANSGTPSGSSTNYFYATQGGNGGQCPSALTNLTCK